MGKMKRLEKSISVSWETSDFRWIDDYAKNNGWSRALVIREAVRYYRNFLEDKEKKKG